MAAAGRRGGSAGPGPGRAEEPPPPGRELVWPSVSELSRAARTNILCTVPGCAKVLRNSPALSMHLRMAHRLQVPRRRPQPRAFRGPQKGAGPVLPLKGLIREGEQKAE